MERTSKLKCFIEAVVCDTHLPLDKVSNNYGGYCGLRCRRDSHAPTVRLRRDDDIDEFSDIQWGVLAPSFNGSDGTYVPHTHLEDSYKLVKHFGERCLEQDNRYKMPTDTSFAINKQSGGRRHAQARAQTRRSKTQARKQAMT
jgi:hypothetical protein